MGREEKHLALACLLTKSAGNQEPCRLIERERKSLLFVRLLTKSMGNQEACGLMGKERKSLTFLFVYFLRAIFLFSYLCFAQNA